MTLREPIRFDSARIEYSDTYCDDKYEYRHVILPHETTKERENVERLRKIDRLLSEGEWRMLGLQMSSGWTHFGYFGAEPYVLLFRRTPRDV